MAWMASDLYKYIYSVVIEGKGEVNLIVDGQSHPLTAALAEDLGQMLIRHAAHARQTHSKR